MNLPLPAIALLFATIIGNYPAFAGKIPIILLGDSITEGLGVAPSNAYPGLIEKELALAKKEVEVINAGVSSSTSASGLTRLKFHLKKHNGPGILVLALGANDGLRGTPPKTTKKNLEEIMTLAKSAQFKVLLCGMLMPPNLGEAYTSEFAGIFSDLAKSYSDSFFPFLLLDVGGVSRLNLPDGIHPNDEGHKIIARNLLPYLNKLL